MLNYYIKLQDTHYLQADDRGNTFFSEDLVGTRYFTSDEATAKLLMHCLYPGIPFSMVTLELVPTQTKYYRYLRLGADYMVYCSDSRWHSEKDLPLIKAKPIEYRTPGEASEVNNTGHASVFAYTVL